MPVRECAHSVMMRGISAILCLYNSCAHRCTAMMTGYSLPRPFARRILVVGLRHVREQVDQLAQSRERLLPSAAEPFHHPCWTHLTCSAADMNPDHEVGEATRSSFSAVGLVIHGALSSAWCGRAGRTGRADPVRMAAQAKLIVSWLATRRQLVVFAVVDLSVAARPEGSEGPCCGFAR